METKRNAHVIKIFIDFMRKFILRSNIFHLNLSGMQLGKVINKLVESIKANSTLCCVHLSENNVPLEIINYMDKTLYIPEEQSTRLNKFRPVKTEQQDDGDQYEDEQLSSGRPMTGGIDNYGNVGGRKVALQADGAARNQHAHATGSVEPARLRADLESEVVRLAQAQGLSINTDLKSVRQSAQGTDRGPQGQNSKRKTNMNEVPLQG